MNPTKASRGDDVAFASAGGVSVGGALALLFIALKLCHVIDWAWWQVLAPFWIPAALVNALIVCRVIALTVTSAMEVRERRRRLRAQAGGIKPAEHGPAARWPR
jgi:hypothetical protein